MKQLLLTLITITLCASVVSAQSNESYKEHPGYIDFGSFEQFQNAERMVDVSIKGPLLKFVAKATAGEDPELSKLLDELVLIQVNVFSIEDDQLDDVDSIIQSASKSLAGKQWQRMVRVHEYGQHVEVYLQFGDADVLTGLAVMALGDDEKTEEEEQQAVFVNIVGKIDPEQLAKLSSKFNIPRLDELSFGEHHEEDKEDKENKPEERK